MVDYRRSWAKRYIREAEDDLDNSRHYPFGYHLLIAAARKAQAAIYYSLGDPSSIESLIDKLSDNNMTLENPVLKGLVKIDRMMKKIENMPPSEYEEAFEYTSQIVITSTKIVNLFFSND